MIQTAKKILILTLLSTFVVLFATRSNSTPIGVPTTSEHQWAVGGVLTVERHDVKSPETTRTGELRSQRFLTDVSYGISHRWEGYARMGASKDEFVQINNDIFDYKTKIDLGLGIRGVMYDSYQGWKIITMAQYSFRPNRTFNNTDIDIKEWIGAGTVQFYGRDLQPYIGVSYKRLDIGTNNLGNVVTSTSENKLGAHIGIAIDPSDRWKGFGELQLLNGVGLSGGVSYKL